MTFDGMTSLIPQANTGAFLSYAWRKEQVERIWEGGKYYEEEVDLNRNVKIGQKEILGSRTNMHGYILTSSSMREPLIGGNYFLV